MTKTSDQFGDLYLRGVQLFNSGHFFDAHEVLEDVWRAVPSAPDKKFLQGLIQLAVAFHHHSTGNVVGACSLMRRATRNLSPYAPEFGGIRLDVLLHEVGRWQEALDDALPPPPLPRLEISQNRIPPAFLP